MAWFSAGANRRASRSRASARPSLAAWLAGSIAKAAEVVVDGGAVVAQLRFGAGHLDQRRGRSRIALRGILVISQSSSIIFVGGGSVAGGQARCGLGCRWRWRSARGRRWRSSARGRRGGPGSSCRAGSNSRCAEGRGRGRKGHDQRRSFLAVAARRSLSGLQRCRPGGGGLLRGAVQFDNPALRDLYPFRFRRSLFFIDILAIDGHRGGALPRQAQRFGQAINGVRLVGRDRQALVVRLDGPVVTPGFPAGVAQVVPGGRVLGLQPGRVFEAVDRLGHQVLLEANLAELELDDRVGRIEGAGQLQLGDGLGFVLMGERAQAGLAVFQRVGFGLGLRGGFGGESRRNCGRSQQADRGPEG